MNNSGRNSSPRPGWHFDNSYTRLPEYLYARLNPVPVAAPKMVIFNRALAQDLGLDADLLAGEEGAAVFSGNRLPAGAEPIAQAYAGHQFGHFTVLGDGRALLLGEQITPHGERFDIQLKGSGRTPYSRSGDGRAALGPMLREYLISEAMQGLGIPTTRSLAVVLTGEPVYRETTLPGAILTRVPATSASAPSNILRPIRSRTDSASWPNTPCAAISPTRSKRKILSWPCCKPYRNGRCPWWPAGCWSALFTA